MAGLDFMGSVIGAINLYVSMGRKGVRWLDLRTQSTNVTGGGECGVEGILSSLSMCVVMDRLQDE